MFSPGARRSRTFEEKSRLISARKNEHSQIASISRTLMEATMIYPPTLPDVGFVRLPEVLRVFPVSKSTWWQGVRDNKYPKPVKLGERATAWRVEDIRELLERIAG